MNLKRTRHFRTYYPPFKSPSPSLEGRSSLRSKGRLYPADRGAKLSGNSKWKRTFSEFPNFRNKWITSRADRNFRNELSETFCSIQYCTGISAKFGRMERAPYVTIEKRCINRFIKRRNTHEHQINLIYYQYFIPHTSQL